MEYNQFGKKYVLRIDKGEEIVKTLTEFCTNNNIKLGTVQGLGATNNVKIGLYQTATKQYVAKEFQEDFEIAPLFGIISTMDGKTYIHTHINLSNSDMMSIGGHLNRAVVSATFECVITVIDGVVDRKFDEEIGLNLLRFQ